MRITKLELQNFKRFTDLTLENIPPEAKLVLLIGSNGSGKSSIFDAFDYLDKWSIAIKPSIDYYGKNNEEPNVVVSFADGQKHGNVGNSRIGKVDELRKINFVGRSSIRIVPRISNSGNLDAIKGNKDRPGSFIDADVRFNNDLTAYMQQIDNALRAPVFSGQSADTLKIFQESIQPLNSSLINILGGDELTTIQIAEYQNPTQQSNGKLIFKKGSSRINYDLLSHGEKQVVILLLNFIVRKEEYKNAIIYIDEMDCHLNTSLQRRLLEEIVNVWIPDDSQLWTASHALGFIDYAKNAENAALIDLDLLNFDIPQVILPEPHESMEVYDIAVPKEIIKKMFVNYKLVAVENKNDEHYNLALGEKNYLFVPASNSHEVFLTAKGNSGIMGLRDRDFLKINEIEAIQKKFPNMKILLYYAFENYIYHPDNLLEMGWPDFDRSKYIQEIITQKNNRLLEIVEKIATARQKYTELKEFPKDEDVSSIREDLRSDAFETFYPFFSMKTYFDKGYFNKMGQPSISSLVKTNWFRNNIWKILNS